MLLALYLFLVIALPLALGAFVAFNGLPRSRRCPACAGETLRLQSRLLATLSRFERARQLEARWCPSCEWQGTARPHPLPLVSGGPALLKAEEPDADPEPEWAGNSVEIRRICVNGDAWRIRVQCWAEDGTWQGRLLFVAPSGRSWLEDTSTLSGPSPVHVLSQVLSLPDQALAGRIRKATR